MKTIKLKCEECGKEFERLLKEYKRSKKQGRKNFCGRTCQATFRNKNMSPEFCREHYYNISKHAGSNKDKHSPFRYFVRKCKQKEKDKQIPYDIDFDYLEELWHKQNGVCPYTKIKMILPKTLKEYKSLHSIRRASLDRIDSTKGYIKGNVEFVCLGINFAKNDFSKEETISFIDEIKTPPLS